MKDNANPIIHAVSKNASTSTWETILEAELSSCDTPANRAVRLALHDSTSTTLPPLQWPAAFPWTVAIDRHAETTNEDILGTTCDGSEDPLSANEVFECIRNIQDPEHPLTLEQLNVVRRDQIVVEAPYIRVRFTPTIPHCSMATLIGLTITVKLIRSVPTNCKVQVSIEPGTHNSESSINKQLADKERVCAALENKHLLGIVNKCIAEGMRSPLRDRSY
jgi:metal-sulfur cluster biosynthetic enzyme